MKYSSKQINEELIKQLTESLKNIRGWGSVEIIVQNFEVTQITEKNILKPLKNERAVEDPEPSFVKN